MTKRRTPSAPTASTPLQAAIGELHLLTIKLTNRVEGVEDRIEKLEVRVGGLEDRVEKLEVQVGQLEVRIGRLEVRVGQLEHRIKGLEDRVEQLEIRMTQLQADVQGLREEMRTNHNEIIAVIGSAMQTISDVVQENTVATTLRFNSHEARIQSLEQLAFQ